MLKRHFPRIGIEVLKNLDENHLGQVFLTHSSRQMGAHQTQDEGVKVAEKLARRILVALRNPS